MSLTSLEMLYFVFLVYFVSFLLSALFVYFGLSMFEAFLEIFDSLYVPKTDQKGGRPILFSTINFIAQVSRCGFFCFTEVLHMSGSLGLLPGAISAPLERKPPDSQYSVCSTVNVQILCNPLTLSTVPLPHAFLYLGTSILESTK